MVSDIVSEPATKKIRSLTSAIINAADNGNLDKKLTITKDEGYVAYSKTHVEEAFYKHQKHL